MIEPGELFFGCGSTVAAAHSLKAIRRWEFPPAQTSQILGEEGEGGANGAGGSKVPVIFLDANLPSNSDYDKSLTDYLYGGDARYRLCQEAILGIGGARMLNALGLKELQRYHMNEGHASLLTLELLNDKASRKAITHDDLDPVRRMCVFTTHTPVPAGQRT
jgi:starch phosphorylase